MRAYLAGLATGILIVSGAGAGYSAGYRAGMPPTPDSVFAVSHGGNSLLRVNVDGRVGIGTSTPNGALQVVGDVSARDFFGRHLGVDESIALGAGSYIQYDGGSKRDRAPSFHIVQDGPGLNQTDTFTTTCTPGDPVIGGGIVQDPASAQGVIDSAPDEANNGWKVTLAGQAINFTVYAICTAGLSDPVP
jgi:hypothetical protein